MPRQKQNQAPDLDDPKLLAELTPQQRKLVEIVKRARSVPARKMTSAQVQEELRKMRTGQ